MSRQFEIPMPQQTSESVLHHCKDELKAQAAAKQRGQDKMITSRQVTLHSGLDPRWKIGECTRCGEQITRKFSK